MLNKIKCNICLFVLFIFCPFIWFVLSTFVVYPADNILQVLQAKTLWSCCLIITFTPLFFGNILCSICGLMNKWLYQCKYGTAGSRQMVKSSVWNFFVFPLLQISSLSQVEVQTLVQFRICWNTGPCLYRVFLLLLFIWQQERLWDFFPHEQEEKRRTLIYIFYIAYSHL